ncbi:MAG: hypothetical protein IKV23_04120, partial [Bacteroidaceae bacterium]|nr:hypothetical protein [Bacteroidaceae bacterium]
LYGSDFRLSGNFYRTPIIFLRILEQASEKASLRTHTKTAPSSSDKDVQRGRVLPTGQILQDPILYYFVRPTE